MQQIATLLLGGMIACLAPACGGSSMPPSGDDDTLPNDPGPDAPAPARGGISVTVNDLIARTVVPDATVAFIDPDGTTTIARTDASGHASALITAGASVTVKYSDQDLQSILDVQPGDELVFGAGQSIAAPTATVSFTPLVDATVAYALYTSCNGGIPLPSGGGTVELGHCEHSLTDADVYVLAARVTDDESTAVASVLLHHVDLSAGKPIVMPEAWTPATSLAVSYTNPIDLDELVTEVHDRDQFLGATSPTKPDWTTKIGVPSTGGDAIVRTVLQRVSSSPTSSGVSIDQVLEDHLDAGATSYTADLTARTRPWLSGVIYNSTTHEVSTTTDANAPLDVDAVSYQVFFGDATDPTRWSIYTPTISTFTLPAVPDSVMSSTTISLPGAVDAFAYETPALVGWDAVRPKLYALSSETVDAVADLGTLYVQRYHGFQPAPRD